MPSFFDSMPPTMKGEEPKYIHFQVTILGRFIQKDIRMNLKLKPNGEPMAPFHKDDIDAFLIGKIKISYFLGLIGLINLIFLKNYSLTPFTIFSCYLLLLIPVMMTISIFGFSKIIHKSSEIKDNNYKEIRPLLFSNSALFGFFKTILEIITLFSIFRAFYLFSDFSFLRMVELWFLIPWCWSIRNRYVYTWKLTKGFALGDMYIENNLERAL